MFNSIHSIKIFNWIRSPRKYIVNIVLTAPNKRKTYFDIEVIARGKRDAIEKAVNHTKDKILINPAGIKSLGKVKNFEEF